MSLNLIFLHDLSFNEGFGLILQPGSDALGEVGASFTMTALLLTQAASEKSWRLQEARQTLSSETIRRSIGKFVACLLEYGVSRRVVGASQP